MKFKAIWKLHGKKACQKCNNPDVTCIVPTKQVEHPATDLGYWRSNRREFRKTFAVLCTSCYQGIIVPGDQELADSTSLYYSGYDNYEQYLSDQMNLFESGHDKND